MNNSLLSILISLGLAGWILFLVQLNVGPPNSVTTPKIVIGQKVTNGICEGYITSKVGDEFKVSGVVCPGIEFNFIWEKEENLKSVK